MTAVLVRLGDVAPQRWRNGGGVTRELLAWPSPDDWRFRISVADIEADGPFSAFADVQRWFAVLQGGGVALTIDGAEHVRRPGDAPLRFSGESAATCRLLRGPSRDLNLMLRECPGEMLPVVDGEPWAAQARQCGLYAVGKGRCLAGTESIDVPAESLLWFGQAPDALVFDGERAAHIPVSGWWMTADASGPRS
jgi:uncharacterized protein